SVPFDERAAGFDKIFAGIKALGDGPDGFSQSRAVAQICRSREDIYLSTRIVDVVLPRNAEASLGKNRRECVANNGATPVSHMHGACRVGGHELDIDAFAATYLRIAEGGAGIQDNAQLRVPNLGGQFDIDEPWLCHSEGEAGATVVTGDELTS